MHKALHAFHASSEMLIGTSERTYHHLSREELVFCPDMRQKRHLDVLRLWGSKSQVNRPSLSVERLSQEEAML